MLKKSVMAIALVSSLFLSMNPATANEQEGGVWRETLLDFATAGVCVIAEKTTQEQRDQDHAVLSGATNYCDSWVQSNPLESFSAVKNVFWGGMGLVAVGGLAGLAAFKAAQIHYGSDFFQPKMSTVEKVVRLAALGATLYFASYFFPVL